MEKPTPNIDDNGTVGWSVNGKLHREDGPALEYLNGRKEWWLDGKIHREDGPAVITPIGSLYWYLNHRCVPLVWIEENIKDQNKPTEDELFHMKLRWT